MRQLMERPGCRTGVEDVFGRDDGDGDVAMAAPLPALGLEGPELFERDLPPGAQGECGLGWREAARAGGGGERAERGPRCCRRCPPGG